MLLKVCGHMVCSACLYSLLAPVAGSRVRQAKCPICRKNFKKDDTIKMFFN